MSRCAKEQERPTATHPRASARSRGASREEGPDSGTPAAAQEAGPGSRTLSVPRSAGPGLGTPAAALQQSGLQSDWGLTAAAGALARRPRPRQPLQGLGPHTYLQARRTGPRAAAARTRTSAVGAPRPSIGRATERRAPDERASGAGRGQGLGDGWEPGRDPGPSEAAD